MANCLELGDNFAVNAEEVDSEGVNFYLVLCMQVVHIVEKDFTCQWGIKFKVCDVIVARKYYQKWGLGEINYVFLKNIPTIFLHVVHVKTIKFHMHPFDHRVQGNDPTYILLDFSLLVLCKM